MNCETCIDRLGDLLQGQLPREQRRDLEQHLAVCARCRHLRGALENGPQGLAAKPPPDLTEAVLARTSGAPCRSARERLCDYVDRSVGPVDAALVGAHIETCPQCARTARALEHLSTDLPLLAELMPDERLLKEVLRRTLHRRPQTTRVGAGLAAAWRSLVLRPRFALETAYATTVLIVLLAASSGAPLASLPRRALELVPSREVALQRPATRIRARVGSEVRSVWQAAGGHLIDPARQTAADVARRSTAQVREISSDLGTLWTRLTSELTKNETERSRDEEDRDQGDET